MKGLILLLFMACPFVLCAQYEISEVLLIQEYDNNFDWITTDYQHIYPYRNCSQNNIAKEQNNITNGTPLLDYVAAKHDPDYTIKQFAIGKMWMDGVHILYMIRSESRGDHTYVYGYVYDKNQEVVKSVILLAEYMDEEGSETLRNSHIADYNNDGYLDILQVNRSTCAWCDEEEALEHSDHDAFLLSWGGEEMDTINYIPRTNTDFLIQFPLIDYCRGEDRQPYQTIEAFFYENETQKVAPSYYVYAKQLFLEEERAKEAVIEFRVWLIKERIPIDIYDVIIRENEDGKFFVGFTNTIEVHASQYLYLLRNHPFFEFAIGRQLE